jgi:hypothetical protein
MEKINQIIIKYFGWLLYPESKQGKEHKLEQLKKIYGRS